MPYAPGASYQGANIIAQSRIQGGTALIQAIMDVVGGLTHQASQAKELRSTLSDVDPQNADRYKKMGLEELRGTINARELTQKQGVATLLAQEAQARLAAANATAAGRSQLGQFFRAWSQNTQGTAPDFGAFDAGQGPRRIAQPMTPIAGALNAAAQYPLGAETAGLSRDLPALLRQSSATGSTKGAPAVTPFSIGEGDNLMSGFLTPGGRPQLDPESEKRLNAWRAANQKKGSATAPQFPPGSKYDPAFDTKGKPIAGLYHVYDPDGKPLGTWLNPHSAQQGLGLFTNAPAGASALPTTPQNPKDPLGLFQ